MSLDVSIIKIGKDENDDFNIFELNHLATNFAITCEKGFTGSFVGWLKGLSKDWREIANRDNPDYELPSEVIYDANITHNLGKMADKAGIYEALWRPYRLKPDYKKFEKHEDEYAYEQAQIIYCDDIIPIIEIGLAKLKANPKYYKKFDSENGWGIYDHFVPFVEKYLEALKANPNLIVKTNR